MQYRLSAKDAPSVQAMTRIGEVFKESNSDSVVMIVLEGEEPLGDDAHRYYDDLIRQLKADTTHVQHIQDFWGDPLTAPGAQSADGKAAYVQLNIAGNQGEALANESVESVREIVQRTPAPNGVNAYVTGGAALVADSNDSGEKTAVKITVTTVIVIFIMLLLVYRSIITVIVLLAVVMIAVGGGPRNHRISRPSRDYQPFAFCCQYPGVPCDRGRNGLWDLLRRAVSRGASGRRRSGDGLLHHLPRGRSRGLGLGFDYCRGDVLPQFHPVADVPNHGRPAAHWAC